MSECSCNKGYGYCKPCGSAYFHDNFAHWTSGDSNIDELIKNSQLHANRDRELIEWIEYTNLENVEFVVRGGFGNVYKAVWKDGPITIFGRKNRSNNEFELKRDSNTEVAVKKFRNATHVSLEFLNEVDNLK